MFERQGIFKQHCHPLILNWNICIVGILTDIRSWSYLCGAGLIDRIDFHILFLTIYSLVYLYFETSISNKKKKTNLSVYYLKSECKGGDGKVPISAWPPSGFIWEAIKVEIDAITHDRSRATFIASRSAMKSKGDHLNISNAAVMKHFKWVWRAVGLGEPPQLNHRGQGRTVGCTGASDAGPTNPKGKDLMMKQRHFLWPHPSPRKKKKKTIDAPNGDHATAVRPRLEKPNLSRDGRKNEVQ